MKRLLLSLFCLFVGIYTPLSANAWKDIWCNRWNVMEHNMGGVDDSETTWRHYLANDTIINGQTYTSVNYYWTLEESKVYKIAHVRFSEDKKVYALMDNTEYLVYDFSVQVGDTIETIVGAFYGSMLQQLLVHQIDINEETNRKTIILFPICKCDEDLYCLSDLPIIWIEGVGTTDGFLMGYPPCDWVGGIGCDLLCAYKDDELKYTGDLYDEYGCEYNATEQKPEDLFPTLWGLQRTSFTEYSECSDSYASLFQSKGETITINYNQYLKFGGHYLREENKQVLLYSRLQDKDLVLYDYSLEVGDTLTTLNIDYRIEGIPFDLCYVDYAYEDVGMSHSIDTLIVTDVSMITLLDGKEYKKWTFNNGMEYVEEIGSFGNGQWSGDFFQLIANKGVPTCLLDEHLVCASKNGQLLYQMDDTEMERLGAECLCETTPSYKSQWCDTWNVAMMFSVGPDKQVNTYRYQLVQDTVVDGQTYTVLNCRATAEPNTLNIDLGIVRFADDRKVYANYNGKEYLVYDFSVQIGDTLDVLINAWGDDTQKCLVHNVSIDEESNRTIITLHVYHEYRKEFINDDYSTIKWIEGIGSENGFFEGVEKFVDGGGAKHLFCAYQGDELKYTGPFYENYGCEYNTATNVEDVTTPTSPFSKILHNGQLLIHHDGKTYNVMGMEVK